MWNLRNNRIRKATVLVAVLLAIASIALVIFLTPARELGSGIDLHLGTGHMPNPPFSLLNVIPRNWGWAWKLKEKILGVPRPVLMTAQGFLLNSAEKEALLTLVNRRANQTADQIEAWRFDSNERNVPARIKQLFGQTTEFSGRINSADGIGASLSQSHSTTAATGTVETASMFRTLPKIKRGSVELSAEVEQTEKLTRSPGDFTQWTNFAVGLHMNMPATGAVLILAPIKNRGSNGNVGILISARAQRSGPSR